MLPKRERCANLARYLTVSFRPGEWPGSGILVCHDPTGDAEFAGRRARTALKQATGEPVTVAETLRQAASLLRAEFYTCVVLDQYLFETKPAEADSLMQHMD